MNRVWIEVGVGDRARLDRLAQRTAAKIGAQSWRIVETYVVADGDPSGPTRRLGLPRTTRAQIAFVCPDGVERRCRAWTATGRERLPRWQLADNAWRRLLPETAAAWKEARERRRAAFLQDQGAAADGR